MKIRKSHSPNQANIKQQQQQIIKQLNEINEQHSQKIKEYMNTQQILTDKLQQQEQYITMEQLKCAIIHNNWTQKVGYFLNPLATQKSKNCPEHSILLKHSEQKLILLERIFQTDSKIVQQQDQIQFIQEDKIGRIQQMNSLLIEYEELEQIVESQQNKEQSDLVKKMFSINQQLRQLKLNYINLANKRQEIELQQSDVQMSISALESQIKSISQPLFRPNKYLDVEEIFNKIIQSTNNQLQRQLFCNITLLIHDKLLQCFHLKNERKPYQQIIAEIQKIEQENQFQIFDIGVFQESDITEQVNFVATELPKMMTKYLSEQQLKQQKTILLESQRRIHQIMYEQSMIQCQYNRLEMLLPTQDIKLQKILDRMNHIECVRTQNNTLFQVTFPAQIKQIQQQIQQSTQVLGTLINELHNCTQIEQDYFYKLFPNAKLPKLIDGQINNDPIEELLDENRSNHQQEQQLYHQTVNNLKRKLQNLQEQEGNYLSQLLDILNRKENIPPSEETSMIGTVQIDISQERTTHKYSVLRSRKQMFMNEPTDRSLSSYSFLGHRTSDPLVTRNTKLALKQSTSISSQNPLLSPQSHHISIEQSLSLHSSARKFPCQDRVFKALKRVHRMQNVSAFSSKYVKYNEKMRCLEFYNANRMLHDLGPKESALCMRQVKQVVNKGQGVELVMSKNQRVELVFGRNEQMTEFLKLLKQ